LRGGRREGKFKAMVKGTILLAATGFVGAAIFYSPYVALNAQTALTCPLCPNITSGQASLTAKFVLYALIGGTKNAALLVALGCIVWGIVRTVKCVKRSTIGSNS